MNIQASDSPVLESVQESEAAPAVEQEQNSEAATTSAENQSDADAEDNGEETDAPEQPRRKDGFQRRVEKLNARAREAQLEAEFWKQKALGAPSAAAPAPPAEKPKFSDYNDLEAYSEALTDWKLERKLQEFSTTQRQATVQQTYAQREAEFKKSAPDYDEVLADVQHITFHPNVIAALAESDVGPQVAYELAKNPSEAERISRLTPLQQVKELGRLEERLNKPKATTARTETKAPAPITPTTGKGTKVLDINDPNISFEDFKRLRQEQLKAKKR